jgi:hypothetical protein
MTGTKYNFNWLKAKDSFAALYGNIAFPTVCNFYGSISSVLSATRAEEKNRALQFWFRSLKRKVGLKAAIEERDRTLIRGRNVDWSLQQLFEVRSMDLKLSNCSRLLENKNFDQRVFDYYSNLKDFEVLAVELPTWSHAKKYKGRTDLLAIHEGRLLIIDNKGSNKAKSISEAEEYYIQVIAYRQALKEMFRNRRKDPDADRLLRFLPKLSQKQLSAFDCRIVYFVDGMAEPLTVDIDDANSDFRLNGKYLIRQLRKRLKEFYSFPVVLLDQTEGFWRSKWKRVKPEQIFQAKAFEEVVEEKLSFLRPVVVNMENYHKNKYLN